MLGPGSPAPLGLPRSKLKGAQKPRKRVVGWTVGGREEPFSRKPARKLSLRGITEWVRPTGSVFSNHLPDTHTHSFERTSRCSTAQQLWTLCCVTDCWTVGVMPPTKGTDWQEVAMGSELRLAAGRALLVLLPTGSWTWGAVEKEGLGPLTTSPKARGSDVGGKPQITHLGSGRGTSTALTERRRARSWVH